VQDEVVDTGPLPEIFLSYQWGTQNEVRLLRQHLEMAGYRCWMDVGQMGGGDKLFAKIDAGLRAARVVICCVTNQYAVSDNCLREVVNVCDGILLLSWLKESFVQTQHTSVCYIRR
jgi:hypothetical protein